MNNIPAGYKLVPIEPTREMLDAYCNQDGKFQSARSDWSAMLAAAPTPPVDAVPGEPVAKKARDEADAIITYLRTSLKGNDYVIRGVASALDDLVALAAPVASQATAELPKLPDLEQPLSLIHPTSLQRMILAYATAYGLACYEAGRASRAQSEPSHQVAVQEASIPPGYIGEHVALKRLLYRSDELPLHAHKRKIVRDWIEAELEAVDDAARASLVQQPATLGETK